MQKKLLRKFLLTATISLLFIFILIFTIDPMQQYRKASLYTPVYSNSNYLIPGLMKNHDCNSIILGSSMIENFILSDVQQLAGFQKPLKLSYSGAMAKNIKIISDMALETKKIDSVLLGLDIFSLGGSIDRTAHGKGSIPLYLYDENIFNDYKYIFNIDILFESVRPFIYKYTKGTNAQVFKFDTMFYNNISSSHFEKEVAIKDYNARKKNLLIEGIKNKKFYSYKNLTQSFDNNILPMLHKYPKTNFVIFYPPYSILTYKFIQDETWLENYLNIKYYIFNQTKNLKNVQIYDFQTENKITHNLHNYRDYSHYSYKVNSWIIEEIKKENYRVTQDDLPVGIKNLQEQINKYRVPSI